MSKIVVGALLAASILTGGLAAYLPASQYHFVSDAAIEKALSGSYKGHSSKPEYYHRKCETQESHRSTFARVNYPKSTKGNAHLGRAADNSKEPNYCDLAAQYVAARAAEKSASWTKIASLVALLGLFALVGTVLQTNKAISVAREGQVLENRPWLSIDVKPRFRPTPQDGGIVRVVLSYTIHNHGNSPAINLRPIFRIFSGVTVNLHDEIQKILSTEIVSNNGGPEVAGMAIFPGKPETTKYFRSHAKGDETTTSFPIIIGFKYDIPSSGETKHTVIGFYLSRESKDPKSNWVIVEGWIRSIT